MGLSSGDAEGVAVGVWLHSGNLNRGFGLALRGLAQGQNLR